jgi:hypothetical protein
MNTIEARAVLDRTKDGQAYSPQTIAWALVMTGDMDESEYERIYASVRGAGMAGKAPQESTGVWQT